MLESFFGMHANNLCLLLGVLFPIYISGNYWYMCVCEVAQSCPTLWDPVDYSPPGSSVHGILQARRLEWVAISFFRGSSQPRDRTRVSCIAGRRNEPPGKPSIRFSVYYIGSDGKESTCQSRTHRRCGFDSWVGKIPWRRKWQPIPVFLPGESHGQRSLVGYSPRGCRESHTT